MAALVSGAQRGRAVAGASRTCQAAEHTARRSGQVQSRQHQFPALSVDEDAGSLCGHPARCQRTALVVHRGIRRCVFSLEMNNLTAT